MQWLRSLWRRSPLPLYVGAIVAITAALTTILLEKAHRDGVVDAKLIALGVLLLLATSQLAVGMVNWLATLLVTPHALPRMDFSRGIAPRSRTLVVVPTLLVSPEGIESLVEALEVRYLANRDDHLHFGLLTDFPDAAEEARARGRGAARPGAGTDRRPEREAWACANLLSPSPPAPLERAGTRVDGP